MSADYLPNHFYPREDRKLSLRECAMNDALAQGVTPDEFRKMRKDRARRKTRGVKTNVGNPSDKKGR